MVQFWACKIAKWTYIILEAEDLRPFLTGDTIIKSMQTKVIAWRLLFVLAGTSGLAAQEYTIVRLDPTAPGQYNFSTGVAINKYGVVVGNGSAPYTTDLTTIWLPGQTVGTPLYVFGYNRNTAQGINDDGNVVGYGPATDNNQHGFYNSVDLGTGKASAINNNGQVVGWSYDSLYLYQNGVFDYLPTSYWGSEATTINDSGVAAGYWYTDCPVDCLGEVCLFRHDSLILLGRPAGDEAQANDINNKGQLAGWTCYNADCSEWRGFIWDDGNWTIVPTLGGIGSEALAINDYGVVVGQAYDPARQQRAIIYDTINGLRDLNTLIPSGSGWDLVYASDINNSGQIVGYGRINGLGRAFLLNPPRTLTLKDANGDILPFITVSISRMRNDPPAYTVEWTEEHTSDGKGEINLVSDSLAAGDSIRVSLVVKREPSYKPSTWLGTLYTITLDNMVIGDDSRPDFPELRDGQQEVILSHTTIAWNVLVSIEWDARVDYITTLQTGFRGMSNYLYDVSDGQMRIDTVVILDEKQNWAEADFRVFTSNVLHAFADRVAGVYHTDKAVNMPRKWFGSETGGRNTSFTEDPLDMSDSVSYATFCHEYGHYAFGFWDEYQFLVGTNWVTATGRCGTIANYGFMDGQYPYPSYGPYRSEMSTAARYIAADCRNNAQWYFRGMSCWDWFRNNFEGPQGPNSIFVPIKRPQDRVLPSGFDYLPGPNDVLTSPDYDVGADVVFPAPVSAPTTSTLPILLAYSVNSLPLRDVNVRVKLSSTGREMDQGNTSDDGKIRLLGITTGDEILVSGLTTITPLRSGSPSAADLTWVSTRVTVGNNPMLSPARPGGNIAAADSLISLAVSSVSPNIRMIPIVDFGSSYLDVHLLMAQKLSSIPNVDVADSSGAVINYPLSEVGNDYTVSLPDGLPAQGSLWLNGVDDSTGSFIVPLDYRFYPLDSAKASDVYWTAGATASVTLDTSAHGPGRIWLLASDFPVLRDGLDASAQQAGPAVSLAASTVGLLDGEPTLLIRYDETDVDVNLGASEEHLKLWQFDETARHWVLLGGTVDTSRNEVSGTIVGPGVYAAFAVASPTGIIEEPDSDLPISVEIFQNYPNPFNPATTIAYRIPSRTKVRIEVFNVLGQRVITLVDESQSAGDHVIQWDGKDDAGNIVSTGVYLYRIQAGEYVQTRKMLLLK